LRTEHLKTTAGVHRLRIIRYKLTTIRTRRWAVFVLWSICCITACGEDPSPQMGSQECGEDPSPQVGSQECGEDPSPQVGSQECGVLTNTPGVSGDLCTDCQGQACQDVLSCDIESDPECGSNCALFPCVDGQRVVQGCESDSDCSEFEGFYCGLGTSMNKYLCGSDMGDF
jgi:hypothetical protein